MNSKLSNSQILVFLFVFAVLMVTCQIMCGDQTNRPPAHSVEEYARQSCPGCDDDRIQSIVESAEALLDDAKGEGYIRANGVLIAEDRYELAMKNEFASQCLQSGFSPVYKVNGDPMVNGHEDVCYMRTPLAKAMTEANKEMFADTGVEISPLNCWRPNNQQAVLYVLIHPGGGACAKPGHSFHNMGLAIDVNNWRTAGPYLADIGMIGGCDSPLVDDNGHYSLGELTEEAGWLSGTCQFSPGAANALRKGKRLYKKYKPW